ncbi:cyclopropane-fatty-acyl-phospholipid synthase family protein [Burkholderia sp. BCC0405]|uniref:SAM-dependent methyltransferase n=1 Tax=Burkholderia sp. BCC0405 TaxID=2676298 RepID=UPI00158F2990|nr:cyclopropane-fatty-acyl-phospholipid synthase family protein [Burkholderia sp. BCC0405]
MTTVDEVQVGTTPQAIREHYDLSDDFYALWLDRDMVYSCALFDGSDDLHDAQMRKLDHHIAEAHAAGAARVLDIGCGWGALLRRLAGTGVGSAVGLTLSRTQAARIARDAVAGTSVRLEAWQDHRPAEPYDAIISIGAFEHFATRDMSDERRLAAYRQFFAFCRRNLRPGGRISLQTIAYVNPGKTTDTFVPTTIFRESELPYASEILRASELHFEIAALRNDRFHYLKTCRLWAARLAARREKAVELVGEEATRNYERYLAIAAAAFKTGALGLLRMTLVAIGPATPAHKAPDHPR